MFHQVNIEVDGAVESHEEVGDVCRRLDPVRPLHLLLVVDLEK